MIELRRRGVVVGLRFGCGSVSSPSLRINRALEDVHVRLAVAAKGSRQSRRPPIGRALLVRKAQLSSHSCDPPRVGRGVWEAHGGLAALSGLLSGEPPCSEHVRQCYKANTRPASSGSCPYRDIDVEARTPGRSRLHSGRIRRVKVRRGLLVVVLVYVGLDLSLPMMPGAFVFEPAQSVESIGRIRGRLAVEAEVLPTPANDSMLQMQPDDSLRHRLPPPRSKVMAEEHRPVVSCQPPAHYDTAQSSEDPH
jgi:hypothetical protein